MNQGKIIKYSLKQPWTIAWLVIGLMISVLLILLFWEYHSLTFQTEKIRLLQDQYYEYMDVMKKVLRKKKNDELIGVDTEDGENNDDIDIDSFMVINRGPTYLKESMLNYFKEQQLESLLDRMNLHELQNYTEQVLEARPKSKIQSVRRKRAGTRRVRSPWTVRRRPSVTGIQFGWPIERKKFWLSSFFGPRKKPNGQWGFHKGVDMAAQRGTPVHASVGGVVEQAGYASGYGNTIVIAHDSVYKTRYAHLDSIFVRKNQKVRTGQRIGAVGDTGFTRKTGKDASHLHFELYERGKQVNPLYLLPRRQ